jgi:hypothetical protein
VHLRDAFIIERRPVPECELALVVAGEQSPTVGRPCDYPRCGPFFVDGGMYELVTYGCDWVAGVRSRR